MADPRPAWGERRIAAWLAVVAALAYLPFNHCHFKGTDETGSSTPRSRSTRAARSPSSRACTSSRAETLTIFALAASFLYLCGRFLFWHGLWSAPGPRYLFVLTPLLLLPLGSWLDAPKPRWQIWLAGALAESAR